MPRLALDLAIDDAAYSINVRERLMESWKWPPSPNMSDHLTKSRPRK